MATLQKRIHVPWTKRLRRFLGRAIPVAIWIAALGTCVHLMQGGGRTTQFMGAAEALKADVIAQEQSTIRSLLVEMFAEVSKGDYVGMLDDSSLNAEIDVLNAGRKVVEAEIGAERARLVQEESDRLRSMDIDGRRLALDVETARMELLDRKVAEQVHQIELQRLAVNFQRIERLAEEGSVSAAEADDIRLQMEAVAKDIEENESVIATAEANLQASKDRLSALAIEQGPATEDSLESYLHPLSTEVAELNAQTRQLELSRERWVLKAPIDGVVVSVYRRVGEAVAIGEPILAITNTRADHIIAYVPERQRLPFIEDMAEGDSRKADLRIPVSVRRWNGGPWSEANITRVGPAVMSLSLRLLSAPNALEYGIPVQVTVPQDMKVRPGERVVLRISS